MVVQSNNFKNTKRNAEQNKNVDSDETVVDDSQLGDVASRNAPTDGLSDLERVRRGVAKRAEEEGEANKVQEEEAANDVSDASESVQEEEEKPKRKRAASKKSDSDK